MNEQHDLIRFVEAQATTYNAALRELRAGAKTTHWMWFIFPQIAGLGQSAMSRRYAITSRTEAAAFLAHPTLGARLRDCAAALLAHPTRSAREILGEPDDLKLRSSATLFAAVEGSGVFTELLERFFDGEPDEATLDRLRATDGPA